MRQSRPIAGVRQAFVHRNRQFSRKRQTQPTDDDERRLENLISVVPLRIVGLLSRQGLMKIQAGQTVLLTGASGGLGKYMTEAFAARGMQLALVAYPGVELESVREFVQKKGIRAISISADLRDAEQRRSMLDQVRRELGEIHVLV